MAAVLATAHDMDREWRILDALHHNTTVPVPEPLAQCTDTDVIGAPFYVMDFVEGLILRTPAEAAGFTPDDYEAATDSLVDVQVNLHGLDVDAVGLGDLARNRTNYVARQLRRWKTQVDNRGRGSPVIDEVHDELVATIPPEQGTPGLVHGDYRFDNTVLGADRRVIAVLDWELATIGDPVADFAWSLLTGPTRATRSGSSTPPRPSTPASPARPRSSSATRSARAATSVGARLVHRLRLLEDGLHRRGRVRAPAQGRFGGRGARSRGDRDRAEGLSNTSRDRFAQFVGQTGSPPEPGAP